MLTKPVESLKAEAQNGNGMKEGAIGYAIIAVIAALVTLLASLLFPITTGQLAAFGLLLSPLAFVVILAFTFVAAGLIHIGAKLLGGKGSFGKFYYLTSTFTVPIFIADSVLGFIPCVGPLIGLGLGIYGICLIVLALRELHGFSTLRAFGAWLLSIVVITAIMLALVMTIATSIYVNPFAVPEQCMFDQAGFLCMKPILLTNGLLHATLVNGDQHSIELVGISCIRGSTAPSGDITNTDSWPAYTRIAKTLGPQDSFDVGNFKDDSGNSVRISCVDMEGKTNDGYAKLPANPAIALGPNENFSGRLYVAYRYSDDSASMPAKIVRANLVTRVQ